MVAHTGFHKPSVLPNKHLCHCLCTFLDITTVLNQHYKSSFSLRIKFLAIQPIFFNKTNKIKSVVQFLNHHKEIMYSLEMH